ncbi:MAG TPA: GGDEF domain-containing protein [Egicoccus sp.]|nr:GGDEF domain-containing protein [Egicoccus sp.]HSK22759.1 GGDEF domain-containing protein [Egicoccus sp.]
MGSHLMRGFLACVAAATAVYALASAPTVRDLAWLVVAWAPVVAIGAGIRLHRPSALGPWVVTAVGLALAAVGWTLSPTSQVLDPTHQGGVGELFHVAGTLTIAAAVLWFARLQTPDDDRESIVDGFVVAVALVTVLWTVIVDPAALGAGATLAERVVYVVAPIVPIGVTAVCIRLLFAAGGRLTSARLLGGAWLLAAVGATAWILLLQSGSFVPGGSTELTWAAALACAGASALHPSMVQMSERTTVAHRAVSTARLLVLGIALVATPAALVAAVGIDDVHVGVPVAGAGLVALLVLGRLARLIDEREVARHDLEVHAARQEVVAGVGQAALGNEPTSRLYTDAATLADEVLDGIAVRIAPPDAVTAADETGTFAVPILSGEQPCAMLVATHDPRRPPTAEERAFLVSIGAVLSGLTARRHAEDDLRRRALYDDLTGLPNRALVLERLGQAVRRRDRGQIGVLFVDLDGFKPVNDEHGHETGDGLLAVLAARLPEAVRAGDTVGRLAGDEFVVVAPDCDREGLAELAARVVAIVQEPAEIGDLVVSVTASVGAALAGSADADVRAILRHADAAMYTAKATGGGCVSFAPAAAAQTG